MSEEAEFAMSFPMLTRAFRSPFTAVAVAVAGLAMPSAARASFLPPEMMDTAATYLAWFIIFVVPIGGIVLFWLVHVLPEKIAAQAPPSADATPSTRCACCRWLFGGLLWPIAWLWAYTKPVGLPAAYGTEKHEDYYHEMGEKAQAGELLEHELAHLRDELDAMAAKGSLTAELRMLRKDLAAAQAARRLRAADGDGAKAGSA